MILTETGTVAVEMSVRQEDGITVICSRTYLLSYLLT